MLRRIREGYGWKAGALGTAATWLKECPILLPLCQLLFSSFCYLIYFFLLVFGKADLRNNLSIMSKIFVLFSKLRCYIDGGTLKVVGKGKGKPDGGWEWKQDDVRSKRSVNSFFYCCFC